MKKQRFYEKLINTISEYPGVMHCYTKPTLMPDRREVAHE